MTINENDSVNILTNENSDLLAVDPSAVWAALISDSQCCIVLAEPEGNICYGNFKETAMCGVYDGCPIRDRGHVTDALPAEQADQLLKCMKRACDNNDPVVLIWFLRGQRSRTVVRAVNTDQGKRVLLTTRSVKGGFFNDEADSEGGVIHSLVGDAGPLASLTARETEVLELIGRGYSTAKIAEHLNRSTKTIEWHRASIGNKLNASNRVELARIAIAAGLTSL